MLEGRDRNFWDKINGVKYIEIPVDLSIDSKPEEIRLYNSRKYIINGVKVIAVMYLFAVVFFLGKFIIGYDVVLIDLVWLGLIVLSICGLIALPLLDKRPKVIINHMGIESKNTYISFKYVVNMYIEEVPAKYDKDYRLTAIDKYGEKKQVLLTGIGPDIHKTAQIIGGYYSYYLNRKK
ncbi:MAG: hypothetical protein HWE21_17720 [Cytophagia bacterium]|nr:hypothetical protein [Cytophagia bacterium]